MFNKLKKNFLKLGFISTIKKILFYPFIPFFDKKSQATKKILHLDNVKDKIKGKNVVCIISGSNNDLGRMEEIKERSLLYEGLKHYFMIHFPQRSGALREFLDEVLGPDDDITHFEYTKKSLRESGPAIVGVELKNKEDYPKLVDRLKAKKIKYKSINEDPTLFEYFI